MLNDFPKSITIKIYKNKRNKLDCNNYRGVALLTTTSKVSDRILADRINRVVDGIIPENQAGFRSQRITTDLIFTRR